MRAAAQTRKEILTMQAFPSLTNMGYKEGMHMREYFAIHAPDEIPGWFKHERPESKPPKSGWQTIETSTLNEEDLSIATDWMNDGPYDLPPHLQFIHEAHEAYNAYMEKYSHEDVKQKYFQWRVYYAEQLINFLNPGI